MSKKTPLSFARLATGAIVASATLLMVAGCSSAADTEPATNDAGSASKLFDQKLHDSLPQNIQDSGELKLAAALNDELFNSKKDGEIVGVVPDLTEALGEILGVDVTFVDTPFPGMIPALQANRVDAIWSTMNDTEEREKVLDFVDWIRTSATFMVPVANEHGINSMADICGVRAATLKGAAPFVQLLQDQSDKCVADGEDAVDLKLYDDFPTGMTQLRSGQIDAFFGPTEKLNYIAKISEGQAGFTVLSDEYFGGVYGIGVSKEKGELSTAILSALQTLSDNGTYMDVLAERGIESLGLKTDEFQINGVGAGAFE